MIRKKAKKETQTQLGLNRKQASPTESAGTRTREREHSGADILNVSRFVRCTRYVLRVGKFFRLFPNAGGTADYDESVPEYSMYSGTFFVSGIQRIW